MNRHIAAAVVHDVKNRLVILGDELAKLDRLPLDPEARQHASAAAEQAGLLSRKLIALLTAQRASGPDGLRAAIREESPALFLEELNADALALAGRRIELIVDVEHAPPFWFFDRHLIGLAIDSALHNALRFAASRITLGCRVEAAHLCFFVHDDGPGVQADACATSTGLGRWLCDEIAKCHKNGGRQGHSVLRDHEMGGAVFELRLP
jgi:signal transduction histidine kinase